MAELKDLPDEVLQVIVQFLDTIYEHETGLTIFSVMRVSRRFRDIAIDVHFNIVRPSVQPTSDLHQVEFGRSWGDEKWREMILRMVKHERCYLNYNRTRVKIDDDHAVDQP